MYTNIYKASNALHDLQSSRQFRCLPTKICGERGRKAGDQLPVQPCHGRRYPMVTRSLSLKAANLPGAECPTLAHVSRLSLVSGAVSCSKAISPLFPSIETHRSMAFDPSDTRSGFPTILLRLQLLKLQASGHQNASFPSNELLERLTTLTTLTCSEILLATQHLHCLAAQLSRPSCGVPPVSEPWP